MRIQIKGGVWKNTEDEILKAAVMKYGKNQWARISSLLVRKTPKQCKARWYEWLDPSIKKTEWTREEDEKLLHLAKIMPTQWRTIAPIIGRTASQCLERYERLLDMAQEKEMMDQKDDPRRLRPGEIDPNPEAKPARPDPIDMDEDEKEMLSEARARLANTKGKKAKRKAREKQLEEARRMASLQKRRELKAAGIDMGKRRHKRKWGVDYVHEIPFQKVAPKGFFDTTGDARLAAKVKAQANLLNKSISDIEGKSRDEQEERERKKDVKRQKLHKKINLPAHIEQINKMNDPEALRRRALLNLPAPQVSDRELEEVAKLDGLASIVTGGGATPTKTLISSYGATPAHTPQRTLRTPAGPDTVRQEAQNLIALTTSATPLLGGPLTPNVLKSDFSGITPQRKSLATPNLLATPVGGQTPLRGGIVPQSPSIGGTPMRDQLSINPQEAAEMERRQQIALKKKLSAGLADLPAPKNEYQIIMPDLPADTVKPQEYQYEEDAADIIARSEAAKRADEMARLNRRSQVLKRELPRPAVVNSAISQAASDHTVAAELVVKEMLHLLRYDAAKYPVLGAPSKQPPNHVEYSDTVMSEARKLVESEYLNSAPTDEIIDGFAHIESQVFSDSIYLPGQKHYGFLSEATKTEKLNALQQELGVLSDHLTTDMKKTQKLENKTDIVLGGYQKRAQNLSEQIIEIHHNIVTSQLDLHCFQMLQSQENTALPLRLQKLRDEVAALKAKEKDLQTHYGNLTAEAEQLRAQPQS